VKQKRKVRFHRDFSRDLNAQAAWLARHDRAEWVGPLRQAVIEAAVLLAAIPHAGVRDPSAPLFKLVLRKLPFVVWYSARGPADDVVMLRLFHTKQDRARRRELRGRSAWL
jgi:plasmid stabilization system protein ParE